MQEEHEKGTTEALSTDKVQLPMTRRILTSLAIITALTLTPALQTTASARIELSDMEVQQIRIEQKGSSVIIYGAAGKTANIYNLIGVKVMSVQIDSAEKRIDLSRLTKGIYPIKVDNVSKKVHISNR